jgi:hypothetical protein
MIPNLITGQKNERTNKLRDARNCSKGFLMVLETHNLRVLLAVLISVMILNCDAHAGQNRKKSTHESGNDERLERAREELVSAAEDYKKSLRTLLALQESDVKSAEELVRKRKEAFAQSVIGEKELEESQRMLELVKSKVTDTRIKLAEAELLIKEALHDSRLSSQKKAPYDKAVLLRVLKLNALPTLEIEKAIEQRGVSFRLTPEDYDEFSAAGAPLSLLKVIASNFRRQ